MHKKNYNQSIQYITKLRKRTTKKVCYYLNILCFRYLRKFNVIFSSETLMKLMLCLKIQFCIINQCYFIKIDLFSNS